MNSDIFIKCNIPAQIADVCSRANFFDYAHEGDIQDELLNKDAQEIAKALAEAEYKLMREFPENYSEEEIDDGIILTKHALDNIDHYKNEIVNTLIPEFAKYVENDDLGWEEMEEYQDEYYDDDGPDWDEGNDYGILTTNEPWV